MARDATSASGKVYSLDSRRRSSERHESLFSDGSLFLGVSSAWGSSVAAITLGDQEAPDATRSDYLVFSTGNYDPRVDRIVALLDSEKEYDELKTLHQELATKKLTDGLSGEEEAEYQMVLWNLDRIEEAQLGPSLDVLDGLVRQHEQLDKQLKSLVSSLSPRGKPSKNERAA